MERRLLRDIRYQREAATIAEAGLDPTQIWNCAPASALAFSVPVASAAPALLHHLVRRHWAPQIGRVWILRPRLRALRIVQMPLARIEIAKRLVLHLIEL